MSDRVFNESTRSFCAAWFALSAEANTPEKLERAVELITEAVHTIRRESKIDKIGGV